MYALFSVFDFAIYRSRKLNSQLENAIQEAMAELDRMSETPQQGAPLPPTHSVVVADNRGRRSQR